MSNQNHIASALTRLRRGVFLCAAGVFLAALIQLFVFGFVHFTDVRYQTLEDPIPTSHRTVVVTPTATAGVRENAQEPAPVMPSIDEAVEMMTAVSIPDVNRVNTTMDVILKRFSQGAVVIGVFSAVGLAVFTLLGSIVAGGASVPGVDKAVSACMWGIGLCLLALPWQDVFASMPFGGVFTGYSSMTSASEGTMDTIQLLLIFVGIPAAAMAGAMVAGIRFGSGVERGILMNSAAAPMDAIDRAMADSRENLSTNRHIGAVNNSFAAPASPASAPAPAAEPGARERAAEPPARRRASLSGTHQDDPGEYKRPI